MPLIRMMLVEFQLLFVLDLNLMLKPILLHNVLLKSPFIIETNSMLFLKNYKNTISEIKSVLLLKTNQFMVPPI